VNRQTLADFKEAEEIRRFLRGDTSPLVAQKKERQD
jgi:hypothetical protein